ncbi:guanylate kinase [Mariniblastus fucicola]|uniref:Guanylate kinase n=1 Tax=Mariniblastus fucicola TaxID=980251 RepID=A0A5B9PGS5_9BACT|nr:guanylate kinase [Mariniblastus fucicola]QEG24460.1 Guanylate kinase [Mariniblastus fucicola]
MSESGAPKGRLIIFSGPSGVGKTTILKQLHERCDLPLLESVSATTRPRRPGETDGVSYHYMAKDEFLTHVENDDFLEYTEVFGRGDLYGTLRAPVIEAIADGKWIILELDVVGALKVLKIHPDAITIFVHPGSVEELERRLRGRGTESEEALSRRLEVAKGELEASSHYEHIVYNTSVQQTVDEICQLLIAIAEKS